MEMKCPYCFSPDVTVVSSLKRRDVAVIHCARCGQTSEVDVENLNADTDTTHTPPPQPTSGS